MGSTRRHVGFALTTVITVLAATPAAAQQERDRLRERCAGGDAAALSLCGEAALAFQAIRGGTGLAAAQGNPVPGSSSTLGRRLGTSPRIALSLRAGITRASLPDARSGEAPADDRSFGIPTLEGGVTLGVLDGFSPLPTVGGILSVDLLGSAGAAGLDDGDGFDGGTRWFGYGVRLGLLRESFTLPGVSVSLARRHLTGVDWGRSDDPVRLDVSPRVTSVRATVGKDFLAFGILGGWGWDRYGGDGRIEVAPAGVAARSVEVEDFTSDRVLFFGGLTYTFLLLQLSAEGGFATGWDEAPGRGGGYDPSGGSLFGSVAGRLTL